MNLEIKKHLNLALARARILQKYPTGSGVTEAFLIGDIKNAISCVEPANDFPEKTAESACEMLRKIKELIKEPARECEHDWEQAPDGSVCCRRCFKDHPEQKEAPMEQRLPDCNYCGKDNVKRDCPKHGIKPMEQEWCEHSWGIVAEHQKEWKFCPLCGKPRPEPRKALKLWERLVGDYALSDGKTPFGKPHSKISEKIATELSEIVIEAVLEVINSLNDYPHEGLKGRVIWKDVLIERILEMGK